MLTDTQVRVLRRKLMEGKTQEGAAAAAGMSVRSARNWQVGPYPSKAPRPHNWRPRRDPFAEVFDSEIVPLLALDDRQMLEAPHCWANLSGGNRQKYMINGPKTPHRGGSGAGRGRGVDITFNSANPPGSVAQVTGTMITA